MERICPAARGAEVCQTLGKSNPISLNCVDSPQEFGYKLSLILLTGVFLCTRLQRF